MSLVIDEVRRELTSIDTLIERWDDVESNGQVDYYTVASIKGLHRAVTLLTDKIAHIIEDDINKHT